MLILKKQSRKHLRFCGNPGWFIWALAGLFFYGFMHHLNQVRLGHDFEWITLLALLFMLPVFKRYQFSIDAELSQISTKRSWFGVFNSGITLFSQNISQVEITGFEQHSIRLESTQRTQITYYIVNFVSNPELKIQLDSLSDVLVLVDFLEKNFDLKIFLNTDSGQQKLEVDKLFEIQGTEKIEDTKRINGLNTPQLKINTQPFIITLLLWFGALISASGIYAVIYIIVDDIHFPIWGYVAFSLCSFFLLWLMWISVARCKLTIDGSDLRIQRSGYPTIVIALNEVRGCLLLIKRIELLTKKRGISIGRYYNKHQCDIIQYWLAKNLKNQKVKSW